MKSYALLAALALALPADSEAGHRRHGGSNCAPSYHGHGGYGGYGVYHGGRSYYRSYSSCYSRPYVYARSVYDPYYSSYYVPSVSFAYVSAPRVSYRAPVDYSDAAPASSLESDVQRALKRRGYYDGSVDGDIGPASRAAIRAFQEDRGLRATGRIDSSLLNSLGL